MPTLRCNSCLSPHYVSVFSEEAARFSSSRVFVCNNCRPLGSETGESSAPTKPIRHRRLCRNCAGPLKSTKCCGVCGQCTTCCSCDMFCSNCNKTHPRGWKICRFCNYCSVYCKCRKRPKFLHGLAKNERVSPKTINSLPRSIALEIEIANWNGYNTVVSRLPRNHKEWWLSNTTKAHDSSVTSGSELVVSPQSGDEFIKGVVRVAHVLKESRVTFDNTCGFHVHVNASDYNSLAIKNILWIWRAYHKSMEGRLYQESRANNNYCKETTDWLQNVFPLIEPVNNPKILRAIFTWICAVGSRHFGTMTGSNVAARHQTDAAINTQKVIELIPSTNGNQLLVKGIRYIIANQLTFPKDLIRQDGIAIVRNHYNPIRYSSVNLASLWYRGSLEFRIKEATGDFNELLMWPLFCGWLTEVAMNESFSMIRKATEHESLAEFVSHRNYKNRRWFPEAVETWVHEKLGVV